jgi:enterochelin esterase-like enzyme
VIDGCTTSGIPAGSSSSSTTSETAAHKHPGALGLVISTAGMTRRACSARVRERAVSVTLNKYAEDFDKAMHRDDLMARIDKAGFGAVQGASLTSC